MLTSDSYSINMGVIHILKLYFKNTIYTKASISILFLLLYILTLFIKRNTINHWGLCIIGLIIFGLWACTYASTRDGLYLTIQSYIDGSTKQGLFSLISLQTILGMVFALIIIVSAIASIFMHNPSVRERIFFIMSGAICGKIIVIEVSRIFMYISSSSTWFNK